MPFLEYEQRRRRIPRRVIHSVVIVALIATLIVLAFNAERIYARWQAYRLATAYRVIDSEIAGTEVYFKGTLLGTTPLLLSRAECTAIGLPVGPNASIDFDGWGEGIPFEDPVVNVYPRLMLKVPAANASAFLTYDTPWGQRTKSGGGEIFPNGLKARFIPRNQNGINLSISRVAPATQPMKALTIDIVATNVGRTPYSGARAEFEVLIGTFDVQWQHRAYHTVPLPPAWANITPGQTLKTTIDVPMPSKPGEYSVFVILDVFRNNVDNTLQGSGSVYSGSTLLRVP